MIGDAAVPGICLPQVSINVNCAFHTLLFKSLFGIIEQFGKVNFVVSTGRYIFKIYVFAPF